VLQDYLAAGDRRCVFLTATPRNRSAWDIYHQLKLFHQDDLTDLPVDPPNLREYFKGVDAGEKRLPELLAHLLIRRTRTHILRWYGYDAETDRRVDPDRFAPYREGRRRAYVRVGGRKQFFPRRKLHTVEYSIEATYQGLYQELRGHMGRPHLPGEDPDADELTYARYGLWRYVRSGRRQRRPYAELQRAGANLRGLMRVMLFKRFESSVYAFRETLKRLVRIHETFLQALDQGIVPAGEEAQALLYESDRWEEQTLMEALAQVSGRYDLGDFYEDALRAHIEQDARVLRRMLDLVSPITPTQDAKLQTLLALLDRSPLDRGKRLIFTQYADTAQYLYENLDPDGSRDDVEVIYGQDKNRPHIVGRFAPRANPSARPAGSSGQGPDDVLPQGVVEINTLVATDVLSEGLNLQDCDKVVNYDLHWNPVRLIQRFGRIDRIGSEHDTIHGFNFLPETELERALGLREKLSRRIQEIHETIGEDAAILDPSEQLNEEAMYTIYSAGHLGRYEEEQEDEFVDLNEAEEIVRQLRENRPELYRRIVGLRDGVRCGRAAGRRETFIFGRAGRYRQLFLVDEAGEIVTREVPRILAWLKCEPDTPAEPLPPGHNAQVMAVKSSFEREVQARRAERVHTLSLTRAQRYVLRELRLSYNAAEDEDLRGQIGVLEAAFRRPNPRPAVRGELNRVRREGLTGMALVDALSRVYHLYGLDVAPPSRREAVNENEDLARVVCSEAGVE
jgi:hypothetical protein